MTVLETERLVLRRLTDQDAEFMLGLLNEPSFLRFIGDRNIRTTEQARDYILGGPMAMYEQYGFGLYLVSTRADETAIGICGLIKRDALPDVDIGFAFLPAHWGRGFAREAARAVLAYGRRAFGLKRIVAITNPDNVVSKRLLNDLGFTYEQTIKLADDAPDVDLLANMTSGTGDPMEQARTGSTTYGSPSDDQSSASKP